MKEALHPPANAPKIPQVPVPGTAFPCLVWEQQTPRLGRVIFSGPWNEGNSCVSLKPTAERKSDGSSSVWSFRGTGESCVGLVHRHLQARCESFSGKLSITQAFYHTPTRATPSTHSKTETRNSSVFIRVPCVTQADLELAVVQAVFKL